MTRNWRTPHKQYTDTELLHKGKQALAMRRVKQAVSNGTFKRGDTCQICGDKCETVAHHHSGYDKPFSVWWICRVCNANLPIHDGSLTLSEAQQFLRDVYMQRFMQRMGIQQASQRKEYECGICGVYCLMSEMQEVDDYVYVCNHCMDIKENA